MTEADHHTEDAPLLQGFTFDWFYTVTSSDYPDTHAYEKLIDPCYNGEFVTAEAREMERKRKEIWQGRSLEYMFAVEKTRAFDAEADFDDFGNKKRICIG